MLNDLWFRLRVLWGGRKADRDLDDELQLHLEHETRNLIASGLEAGEARRRALIRFGGVERVREECRDAQGLGVLTATVQDARYAARQFRRAPGLVAVAIVSLALGIGANTAVFQLLNAVRLKTLPVPRPEELVQIQIAGGNQEMGVNAGRYGVLTRPVWEEIRRDHPSFSGVLAWSTNVIRVGPNSDRRRANGLTVSHEFFPVLEVPAFVGRTFTAADESTCPSSVAMVGYGYWTRELRARSLDEASLLINGAAKQIVGVTPPGFFGLAVGEEFDVVQPFCTPKELPRNVFSVTVMGRLHPGLTAASATQQLHTSSPQIFAATALTGYNSDVLAKYKAFRLEADPAATGVSWLRRTYDSALWLLLGITSTVLLIACATLANLLVARAMAREHELAVRVAIGASRSRLIRQLLVENSLLALGGTAIGLWLAQVLSRTLIQTISVTVTRVSLPAPVDWRVGLFVTGVASLLCLLFGLGPAMRAARANPVDAMRARGATSGRVVRTGVRRALVVAQVALSTVLLFGALLFVSSFWRLTRIDPGMRIAGIGISYANFPGLERSLEGHEAFQRGILDAIRALPGVTAAASTTTIPLLGDSWGHTIQVGAMSGPARFTWVSDDYFRTMGIPVLQGRSFAASDTSRSARVAIVNQAFVRAFAPETPLGQTLRTEPEPGFPATNYQIVGIIPDTQYNALYGSTSPMAFAPASQAPNLGGWMNLLVHSSVPADSVLPMVKNSILSGFPNAIVEQEVLETQLAKSLFRERLMAMLSGFFGVIAVLLAVVGLYGLISFLVTQRRAEIGIRLALGARRRTVIGMLVSDAIRLLLIGLPLGVGLALWAGRVSETRSLLFGITSDDPLMLGAAVSLLMVSAVLASVVPAVRAVRGDTLLGLRQN
jgi:predicted permease